MKITKNMILAAGIILLILWALSNIATIEAAVLVCAGILLYLFIVNWVATRYGAQS